MTLRRLEERRSGGKSCLRAESPASACARQKSEEATSDVRESEWAIARLQAIACRLSIYSRSKNHSPTSPPIQPAHSTSAMILPILK